MLNVCFLCILRRWSTWELFCMLQHLHLMLVNKSIHKWTHFLIPIFIKFLYISAIAVTGFDLWGAVLAMGLVCTLYTTLVREIHQFLCFVLPKVSSLTFFVLLLHAMYYTCFSVLGWFESGHLDGCVPDDRDVCGTAGSDRGGHSPGRWHRWSVEKSTKWQSHLRTKVSCCPDVDRY